MVYSGTCLCELPFYREILLGFVHSFTTPFTQLEKRLRQHQLLQIPLDGTK